MVHTTAASTGLLPVLELLARMRAALVRMVQQGTSGFSKRPISVPAKPAAGQVLNLSGFPLHLWFFSDLASRRAAFRPLKAPIDACAYGFYIDAYDQRA